MSHIISRFEAKESDLDLVITNRAYRILHSIFLDYLGRDESELRLMFERIFAFNGINLETEMRHDIQLVRQYVLVWGKVITYLRSNIKNFSNLFAELGEAEPFLTMICHKVAGWRKALGLENDYKAPDI